MTGPAFLSVAQARRELAARRLSAVELTEAVLARVAALNPRLNAYLSVDAGSALDAARAADRRRDRPPLLGIPVCVKDIVDVRGVPTTAGAARWRRAPQRDAGVVARLREAGAVIIGKGHTNEFAYGVDGMNPHRGDCANPYDTTRMTGGSSSGPAAAVASGMALAAIGTDTSGSIRIPASLCGVSGIRPTPGLLPMDGIVPLAPTYDTVGPMARTVEDAAIVLDVLAGRAEQPPPDAGTPPAPGVRGLRVGLVEPLLEDSDAPVADGVTAAAEALHTLGAEVRPLSVPELRGASEIHTVVLQAEAAREHHAWFADHRDHYAEPVRERLQAGLAITSAAYAAAQDARRRFAERVLRAMEGVDALLAPATPVVAPPRGATEVTVRGAPVPLRRALMGCTVPVSQLGVPVLSVPVGLHAGLPFGMQVVGKPHTEDLIVRLAVAYERSRPPLPRPQPGR